MNILELFSGNGTLSEAARGMGHRTWTVDANPECRPGLAADVTRLTYRDLLDWAGLERFDMVWASPPCESFSVASIGTHWGGGRRVYQPKTEQARNALLLIDHLALLIKHLEPTVWYIENPRGVMRKVCGYEDIPGFFTRHTVTYCKYGDTRMKPTDIWTNNDFWIPRQRCFNNDPCHERAPRGAKTGTQGRCSYLERSRLPVELCREVIEAAEMAIAVRGAVA